MAKAIPAAAAGRIIKLAGAKRVSDKARTMMADIIEEIGLEIAEKAVRIARNCGRKTVVDGDIKLVKL